MYRRRSRLPFLLAIATLLAVQLYFQYQHIKELERQNKAWEELNKDWDPIIKKGHELCLEMVKQCRDMGGKDCGACQ
jgi:hypothetical protein